MKKMTSLFAALFLSLGSIGFAETFRDYDFEQERMMTTQDAIYNISSFEKTDAVTAYSYSGVLLWDKSFHAKITSWQIIGDYIIVFSKHRSGYKTYLTCMDRYTGSVLWERP
jgi:outer membrane protein assembly factor BamB